MKYLRGKILRVIALFMAFNILTGVVAPSVAYALTAGPTSPEFSSFEPVATTDMVNVFTGDFTYNLPVLDIPGPDGAGYSMSLAYHSGVSSEEEASWVGFGWTLNPGAINRNTRGFPDDYNNAHIDYYNKTRPNWTAGTTNDIGIEFFSKDTKTTFGMNASASLRFNNYQGYQRSYGLGVDFLGMVNLGLNYSAQGVTYSAHISPMGVLNRFRNLPDAEKPENQKGRVTDEKLVREEAAKYKSRIAGIIRSKATQGLGSGYGLYSFNESSKAVSLTKYDGYSFNFSTSVQVNAYPPVGLQVGFAGNFNMQHNEPVTPKAAFGFMNNIAEVGENQMSDYYVEKGSSYSKRDYFLGIPFNNADNFNVTGEGLGGGFRFYPQKNGHFYADKVKSSTKFNQLGIEFMVGQNLGIGVDIGTGVEKLSMDNWPSVNGSVGNTSSYRYDSPAGVFRFFNDLGGEVEYSASNEAETASVSQLGNIPGFKRADIAIPTSIYTHLNGNTTNLPAGRSSYIAYHTNEQLSNSVEPFNRTSNVSDLIYRNLPPDNMKSGIAEIAVHNEDGNQYVYGLPTYIKNDASLQFDIKRGSASIFDNYIAYQDVGVTADAYTPDLSKHTTVVGEVKKVPYATNYLLTQILTSDYVDVDGNGVSDKDFGGWTQFNYHKALGTVNDNWYRFRTPYTGLLYQRNSISDVKDDVGSVMSGEKEVYYLKTIETKTHIAFFVTNKSIASRFPSGYNSTYLSGSGNARLDGRGASKDVAGGLETASKAQGGNAARGSEELEYLEKIVLFSKARKDKPIKVTRFDYSYDLVGNLPNSSNGNFPNSKINKNSGKLTLEKVWFEYEGIVNAKISPYVFKYEYKDKDELTTNNEGHLTAKYSVFNELLSRYTKESQNPDYNPHLLDPWGNIQRLGREQQLKDRSWLYQGPDGAVGAKSFDPAAWQLKQIKLPSGGEILVEYEQKDYRYVQDREVMAMASLMPETENYITDEYTNPSYIVNVKDLNITTQAERDKLIEMIQEHYSNGKDKVFFKFLYALTGTIASLDFCKSDYIDGYANFLSVEAVEPQSTTNLNVKITLEGKTVSGTTGLRHNSPRQGCYDLVANQRIGKVDDALGSGCSSVLEEQFDDDIAKRADGSDFSNKSLKLGLIPSLLAIIQGELMIGSRHAIPGKERVCMRMNPELSYLKLPMVGAKKGGGVRVKRLYMLDHGLESGDAALYGTEYLYENEDGTSSGVATNEPSSIRAENPLVKFLPKREQSWFSRITTGEEKDQTEGPLGESLLPSASVGHSRIVVKNIHEGPTGTGFVVHEYLTAKDYPFDKVYGRNAGSEVQRKSIVQTNLDDNTVTDRLKLPAGFFSYSVDKVWAAQGFRFVVNNMHGQLKKLATYGGDYKDFKTDKVYISSSQEYTYFEPGEKIKILKPDGTYSLETPGKEMDVAMEIKSLRDNTMDFSIEMDISITISVWPPVFFSLWPSFQLSDSRVSTHVTSKVLRYPAIVKSVRSTKDGVAAYSENLAFNGSNGKPILVKTLDGFDGVKIGDEVHDGSIYSLTVPASWKYSAMGQKAVDSNNTNQLSTSTGTFVTYGTAGNLINTNNSTWTSNITSANNVLSAEVQTYSNSALVDGWFGADVQANYPGITDAKTKLNKIWRPYETYAYKTDAASSNLATGEDKVYKGGFFKNFSMFNWTSTSQADANWLKLNEVTKYSPHGSALEEKNILGIYSSAKYDYSFGNSSNLLPVMITSNGAYTSIAFDSYETSGNAQIGHSGSKSKQYSGTSLALLSGLSVTEQLNTKGGILKLWLKSDYGTEPQQPEAIVNGARVKMERVAKTGAWTLYSTNVNKSIFPTKGAAFSVSVSYPLRAGENVYIDDVRFQPIDAQSKCYVYDVSTFRLLTQFDDQHFGLYYQYNSEGKLIRKQIETEKGLKTIQETQYNTPKTQNLQ
ncbi:hypothetical protein ACFQ21_18500 [Ohtaekwangia kribbensis]|uniref:Uncharacterized protein n=1 Tax=Ohtaekwangia kribbensis TaxID=688913 RepID=A0ABW3K4Z0_9BACT